MARGSLILAMLMFVTSPAISDATFPGGKCSALSYQTALGTCAIDYTKGMISATKGGPDGMMKYHEEACKNNLVKNTVDCVGEVHKMCGFSLISTATLNTAMDLLCSKMKNAMMKLKNCQFKVSGLADCVKAANFDPHNPLCSVTKVLKNCLNIALEPCQPDAKQLALKLAATLGAEQCDESGKQTGGCSYLSYVASGAMCYAKFGLKFQHAIKRNGKLSENLKNICEMPELKEGMNCHEKVDKRCETSLGNVAKARDTMSALCAATDEIVEIGNCWKPDYKKVLSCITKEVSKSFSVCKLMTGIKTCYKTLFSTCSQGIVKVTDKLYELLRPEACTKSDANLKCSMVSYLSNFGICWAPSVVSVVSKFLPRLELGKTCTSTTGSAGKVCHERIDKMCGGSLMRPESAKTIVIAFCKNGQKILEQITRCFPKNVMSAFDCENMNLRENPVKDKSSLCRLIKNTEDCQMKMFRSGTCDEPVVNFMQAVTHSMTPMPCDATRPVALSALAITAIVALRRLF